jgi:glycosyltransferase involved in cell wall biosynthesis
VAAGQARVSYIIGTYPTLTTTFIDREIEALIERGVDVTVISVRRPDDGLLSASQRALQRRVRYLTPARLRDVIRAQAIFLRRKPATYLGALAELVRLSPGLHARYRTLVHFLVGVYTADRLADRPSVHIHAHFLDRAATLALVAARLLGTTYSVTAHAGADIYRGPLLLAEKLENAKVAVTCTRYNADHLARELGRVVAEKIVVVHHGIDVSQYATTSSPSEEQLPLLLSVGQLTERKGLPYLIEACRLLADRGYAFECLVVGAGPQRGELASAIERLGLASRVRLCGALGHSHVIELYHRATVFALPAVVAGDGDRDGIPNVILEAMASGVPVVSTSVSAIPEVVRDGETGLLVPPRDSPALSQAIAELLESPNLRDRLRRGARTLLATEFDVGRSADLLLTAFGHA